MARRSASRFPELTVRHYVQHYLFAGLELFSVRRFRVLRRGRISPARHYSPSLDLAFPRVDCSALSLGRVELFSVRRFPISGSESAWRAWLRSSSGVISQIGHSRRTEEPQRFAECPLCFHQRLATKGREVPLGDKVRRSM
jgi:hypothetical protein